MKGDPAFAVSREARKGIDDCQDLQHRDRHEVPFFQVSRRSQTSGAGIQLAMRRKQHQHATVFSGPIQIGTGADEQTNSNLAVTLPSTETRPFR